MSACFTSKVPAAFCSAKPVQEHSYSGLFWKIASPSVTREIFAYRLGDGDNVTVWSKV